MQGRRCKRASNIGSGVFLIGLGCLFLTGWWWPGLLFVCAASILTRDMAAGKRPQDALGAWWLIGIGVIFALPSSGVIRFSQLLPLLLIALGVAMLVQAKRAPHRAGKRKNDEGIHRV